MPISRDCNALAATHAAAAQPLALVAGIERGVAGIGKSGVRAACDVLYSRDCEVPAAAHNAAAQQGPRWRKVWEKCGSSGNSRCTRLTRKLCSRNCSLLQPSSHTRSQRRQGRVKIRRRAARTLLQVLPVIKFWLDSARYRKFVATLLHPRVGYNVK